MLDIVGIKHKSAEQFPVTECQYRNNYSNQDDKNGYAHAIFVGYNQSRNQTCYEESGTPPIK